MLSVYSRHYPPCTSDDINYKRCRCPKWINGILGSDGPFIRRSAKTRSWEKAEEFKRELESEYEAKQDGGREVVDVAPEKISVKDAVRRFISSKRNENLAESTLDKLKTIFEKQFLSWATASRFKHLEEIATVDLEAFRDFGQAEPARFAASAFAANGSPAYLYRFSYVQAGMRERMQEGAPHGGEIAFVFGTLGTGGFGPPPPPPTAQDQAVSRMAQSYWVNFAKSGDPNGPGLPTWPRYDPSKNLIFDFHPDGSAGAVPDPWKARLDVMQLATESGKRADF